MKGRSDKKVLHHIFNSAPSIHRRERRRLRIAVIGVGEMGHGVAELAAELP